MKNFKIPTNKETQTKLRSLIKKDKREDMLDAGAYDGRFKSKVICDKKHKKPKYKNQIFE